jgi:hypothetical protein
VDGERLQAAAAFAAGSVLALEQRLAGHSVTKAGLPPIVDVVVEPGRQRYGWYVNRHAFGPDLYTEGRGALLRSEAGTITAQEQLEACWEIARQALNGIAGKDDLAAADRVVSGSIPLPCELRELGSPREAATLRESHYGRLVTQQRGSLTLEPVGATWDFVAYRLSDGVREAVVSVPESQLESFIGQVEAGRLDDLLGQYLAITPVGRRLTSYVQTGSAGFYDSFVPSASIIPPDRFGVGQGMVMAAHPGKVTILLPPTTTRGIPFWLIPVVAVALLVTGGAVALTQFGGGGNQTAISQPQPPEPPPPQPPAQPPRVGPIIADLQTPVTIYSVVVESELPVTYSWLMFADPGQECGVKLPTDFITPDPQMHTVTWSHANGPPDNCRHDASDHPFNVQVTVSDGVNPPVTRFYRGSNDGTGPTSVTP